MAINENINENTKPNKEELNNNLYTEQEERENLEPTSIDTSKPKSDELKKLDLYTNIQEKQKLEKLNVNDGSTINQNDVNLPDLDQEANNAIDTTDIGNVN